MTRRNIRNTYGLVALRHEPCKANQNLTKHMAFAQAKITNVKQKATTTNIHKSLLSVTQGWPQVAGHMVSWAKPGKFSSYARAVRHEPRRFEHWSKFASDASNSARHAKLARASGPSAHPRVPSASRSHPGSSWLLTRGAHADGSVRVSFDAHKPRCKT